jgi:cell division protein FtsB
MAEDEKFNALERELHKNNNGNLSRHLVSLLTVTVLLITAGLALLGVELANQLDTGNQRLHSSVIEIRSLNEQVTQLEKEVSELKLENSKLNGQVGALQEQIRKLGGTPVERNTNGSS